MEMKTVPGYPDYEVTDTGVVISCRKGLPRFLRQVTTHNGYLIVGLYNESGMRLHLVHRIVAMAFMPNDFNLIDINHIDGNKQNNNLLNIEWATRGDNMRHAFRVLGIPHSMAGRTGKRHPVSKPVINLETNETFESVTAAALNVGLERGGLSNHLHGKTASFGGYRWAFHKEAI